MLCFERESMVTVFLILIVMDIIEVTSGLPKFAPQHQRFKRVTLQKCPPGKYKVTSYASKNQTKCAPCEEGTYTETENTLPECRMCYGHCTGNSVQTVPCTPTTNRKCECAPQHYCATEVTTKCEQCKKCGDKNLLSPAKEDYYKQICQPCDPGTFLNTTLGCQPHTNCTVLGKTLHTEGNSTADNYCVDPPATITATTFLCKPKKDKKCECPLGHYCARCGDKELLLPDKDPDKDPGTQMLKCHPHTNCTVLGKILHTEGNSTADNYCVGPTNPSENQRRKDERSLSSYMLWIAIPLCILCAAVIVRSSLCKISNKQGIGMLVKLKASNCSATGGPGMLKQSVSPGDDRILGPSQKGDQFSCICGSQSDLHKRGDDEAEISVETAPVTGEKCVDDSVSESKHTTVMMSLISTKETEAPKLEYKSEFLDIETVSGVVHTEDSAEDNIPFPVQENGRNSNTYYPIEEQSQKQYCQPVMTEAKYGTQTSL